MKNCHCHGNSVKKKWKKHYTLVKHVVHFNTVDNKPFLQRSNTITAWLEGNSTNLELSLAFNPDTMPPRLGTFRFWKPQSLGCAFSRMTREIPSCASKRHLALMPRATVMLCRRDSISDSTLSESISPHKFFASEKTRQFLRFTHTREESKALCFSFS